jgi:hypothetical protein
MGVQWFILGAAAVMSTLPFPLHHVAARPRPRFEDFRPDLGRFARAVEDRCGFAPGAALNIPNQHQLLIKLADPKTATYAQFMCLLDALPTTALKDEGVQVLILGQSLP